VAGDAYGEKYYEHGRLDEDRIALWYYARVVRRLGTRGARLLDFGCGTGHLLRRLAADFETVGYDSSPYARTRARINAREAVVLEEWQSLAPESFDVIVSLHTLEHLRRPRDVVPRLVALLRPGGRFLFVVPNTASLGRRLKRDDWFAYRDPSHHSLLSQGEWVGLIRHCGLKPLWVRGDGWWDPPYVSLLPVAVQRVIFGAPAALQLVAPTRRPFLPPRLGECLIVAAARP
jgi:SAM-dependent methyltransferase